MAIERSVHRFYPLATAFFVLTAGACSRGEEPAYAKTPANGSSPRVTVIPAPSEPYRPVAVTNPVRLSGMVLFTGARPQDSTATPARDQNVCGATVTVPTLSMQDSALADVVVWLSDSRTGRPLPASRRFELVAQKCAFFPLVQAVAVGGTLNVRNDDAVIYRNHAVDTRTGETVTELPFTDAGQVIPLDRQLAAPVLLEVKSTSHPWMRAWVAAFDHPYYAVTGKGGKFSIDGIAQGTYTLKAWHPALGVTTHPVTIGPDGAGVTIRFGDPSTAASPATGAQ
ncbi:MAG TPA: hypothetical protein VMY38_03970 [Gemmatimonadaceae bacterium]|nr:hypothetical protein [Gemmatimonadaceae bacterium]